VKYSNSVDLINNKVFVMVNIFYWLPDYDDIIQEFIWQTKDTQPTYPRVNKFLFYWKNNVDAVINEVVLSTSSSVNYRYVPWEIKYEGGYNG
jgi:Usg protein, probable subunit of phosphoribosylanthranilate isomerase